MNNPPHILIIDDDPMIRLLVAQAIQSGGLQTTEAANGEEGLKLFEQSGADAILLDVMMPNGIDGFETCDKLRRLPDSQHIPVLMMTGLDDLESINRAFEVGATDFITKPINIALLGHRVRYMLKASHTTNKLLDSERHLHRMAYFDTLTDLPNRQFFREHLQHMITLSHRQNTKLGVLFLDLDGFKHINDTLGHHVGDQILKVTGERLRKSLRSSDILMRTGIEEGVSLARLGGDEFTVLLSAITRSEDVAHIAERIRDNLAKPFIFEDKELYTTASIGITLFPDDGETEDELLKNADLAMYHAKRAGGNMYHYFSNKMTETACRRLSLENNLRKAIERNELELYYQPILDVVKGQFCGVEALLRWHCQELGTVSPDEFIPLAEKTGLILEIGEWVLRRACEQGVVWIRQGLSLTRIAVNVSGLQLLHKGFVPMVIAILAETGLDPFTLELELTESALISDESNVLEVLQALKQMGIQLAIDDFGVDYSSLSRLKYFPIDRLKIDKSFIGDIQHNSDNRAITIAIIAMAESMNLKVTGEGVETDSQLAFLKNQCCNEVQGYLLSKPLSSRQIEEFLIRHS